jgi:hypothetical protein
MILCYGLTYIILKLSLSIIFNLDIVVGFKSYNCWEETFGDADADTYIYAIHAEEVFSDSQAYK